MTKRRSFSAWTKTASLHWVRQAMGAAPQCAPRSSRVQAPMSEFSRDRGISRFSCGANLLIRVMVVAGFTRPEILLNAGNRRAGDAPVSGVGVDDRGSRGAVRQILRAG